MLSRKTSQPSSLRGKSTGSSSLSSGGLTPLPDNVERPPIEIETKIEDNKFDNSHYTFNKELCTPDVREFLSGIMERHESLKSVQVLIYSLIQG